MVTVGRFGGGDIDVGGRGTVKSTYQMGDARDIEMGTKGDVLFIVWMKSAVLGEEYVPGCEGELISPPAPIYTWIHARPRMLG